MEVHDAWAALMSAAERVAACGLGGADANDDAVEGRLAELVNHCPGFLDHEYRQAYWQGMQNLKQRGMSGAAGGAPQ